MYFTSYWRFYFSFCIIELGGLFLNCIGNGGLLFKYLVNHLTGFGDVWVVSLDFGGSIGHFVYWLVNDNLCVGFSHYFVDLMSLCPDQKGNHPLRHKYNDRKLFFFDQFEGLINVMQQTLGTMIFFLHVVVKDLNR